MAKKRNSLNYYGAKALRFEDDIMICAGDVETDGLGGKLLMIQWGIMGQVYYDSSENMIQNFFDFIADYPAPCVWFFHFGQYDWRYFLEYFSSNEIAVEIGMRTDTDIFEIRFPGRDGKKVTLRDSYALWSHPLEKLASSFCPELPKLEIDIENFDPTNPDHIQYAKRDIEILLTGLPRLFDMLTEHFGVLPSATAAGTAVKAWQRTLPYDEIYDSSTHSENELFIRQGYYGGLVFLTTTNPIKNAETIDINSSYPDSMEKYGVPSGRAIRTRDYQEKMPGIYRCRVKAPDNLIVPILPGRDKRGNMRWYSGEFETVVTNRELIFAAKQGYEILDVYEGIVFEEMVYPFNEFITKCRLIREAYKGLPEEMVAKLIQNSLYGKYGARRERTKMFSVHGMEEDDFLGALPYDPDGLWYIKKEFDENMRCLPHWAVFITAHSRLKLLQTIYTIGPENVIYGDTDSITVRPGFLHMVDIGDKYGQWKLEKQWQVFRAIAPKVYTGVTQDGVFKGAAKGLPRKAIEERHWRELLEDGASSATALSLASLRVAMRDGVKPAVELTRKSSSLNNSSNFCALPDGNVRLKSKHER